MKGSNTELRNNNRSATKLRSYRNGLMIISTWGCHHLRNSVVRIQIIESLQVIVVDDQRANISIRGTPAELLEALAAQVESVAHQRFWKREKNRQYHVDTSATHVNSGESRLSTRIVKVNHAGTTSGRNTPSARRMVSRPWHGPPSPRGK